MDDLTQPPNQGKHKVIKNEQSGGGFAEHSKNFLTGFGIIQQVVYAFMYNDMIEESAFQTISLHRTKEGAEKAMNDYVAKEKEKFYRIYNKDPDDEPPYEFGTFEAWRVEKIKILD